MNQKIQKANKVIIELKPSKFLRGEIGVFAAANIKKDEKIAEGINKNDYKDIIPWREYRHYSKDIQNKIRAFCIGTLKGFIPPDNLNFNKLSVEWYMNHSCEGNIGFNKNGDFIAIRNIKKGEELTYDYGLAESNPNFKMICKCGSKRCRKSITGNDWKDPSFRKRNIEFMLPALKKL
ncbi:MAG: SET domain-containing protein [Deltaproteobacteria bacterium]|nr:SET domain-containing protein [Deltaproteobacteria bacterium]